MNAKLRFLVSVFFIAAGGLCLHSQMFQVTHYSSADGLPSSFLYDIVQDRLDRIWFTTRRGIVCYDGVTWTPYTMANGLRLPFYSRVSVDRQNRIWAMGRKRSKDIYVDYFDGKIWQGLPVRENMHIRSGEGFSLAVTDTGAGEPYIACGSLGKGIAIWHIDKWHIIDENQGLPSNVISDIAPLEAAFYAATAKGLSVIRIKETGGFEIDNHLNLEPGLPEGPITGIAVEHNNRYPGRNLPHTRIWLAGRDWLGYLERGKTGFTLFPGALEVKTGRHCIAIQPDYQRGVYIGKLSSFSYFDYKRRINQPMGVVNGMAENNANGFYIDSERIIWVLGDRGASKIVSRRFDNYYKINGLLEDEVTTILEYAPGRFILSHTTGVTFWDGTSAGSMRTLSLDGKIGVDIALCRVMDIKIDSRGTFWMTLNDAGLAKLQADGTVTWFKELAGQGKRVTGLWIDDADRVWVGHNHGLSRLENNRLTPVSLAPLPIPIIRKLYAAQYNGDPWLFIASRYLGVCARNLNTGQVIQCKTAMEHQSPGANSVYAIFKDSRERILAGTQAGVFLVNMETRRMLPFFRGDPPIKSHVYFIIEDFNRHLWFGTGNGAVRWNGEEAMRYNTSLGLSGTETNRSGGWIDSRGRPWIGTDGGLSIYNENFDIPPRYIPPPSIHLIAVSVDGSALPYQPFGQSPAELRLSAEPRTLEFQFRGSSFIDEKAIHYLYKLDGFDENWTATGNTIPPSARYTRLSAGTYRFHVKARSAMGVWSKVLVSPAIIVPAPVFQRWWFLALAALTVVWLLFMMSRYVTQRRYAGLLEKQVQERTDALHTVEQKLFQARKMEAIGTLAGGIAHDFNNILGAIVGYSELIADDAPEGSLIRSNAEQVLKASLRAADLVRQILAFSRQSDHERKIMSFKFIINEVLKLVRSSLPATIEIRTDIRSPHGKVMADPAQMHQVLMNLCTNAAQAMNKEGGLLHITLDEVKLDRDGVKKLNDLKPGPYLKLSVSDTGEGIPQAVMKRIFEPYFTTKEPGQGTGLGLAVIHGIIKGHHGDIEVMSQPGEGTTFHVYLPRVLTEEDGVDTAAFKTLNPELPRGSERILLVDDEAALTDLGSKMLQRLGYAVTGLADAEEALALFQSRPDQFDLVITDLTMPRMTGLHFAREVKQTKPGIKVLLCSGFGGAISEDMTRDVVDGYVKKPVVRKELAFKVRDVLDSTH